MSTLPPMMRDQRQADSEHIKLLAIFHFVSAVFAALAMLMLFAHYMFFRAVFLHPEQFGPQQGNPVPEGFLTMFVFFYIAMAIWFLLTGVANIASGICMRARKARLFSLCVAGFNCTYMPLGTILGVFTFMVLLRDSVREQYEAAGAKSTDGPRA